MWNSITKTYPVLIILLMVGATVSGQENLPVNQIEVIKDFDARLNEAEKLPIQAALPLLDSTALQYAYTIESQSPSLQYPSPVLRPLAMQVPKSDPYYKGVLRAGGGAPNSLLFSGAYQFVSNEVASVHASFEHLSANKKKVDYQKFRSNAFQLDGSWYAPSDLLQVDGLIRYRQNDDYYYGYDHTDSLAMDFDDYLHNLKRFDMGVTFRSPGQLSGDIRYKAQFHFNHLQNNADIVENGVLIHLLGEKYLNEFLPVQLEIITDFTGFEGSRKQDLNNFVFKPSFGILKDNFSIHAGLAITAHKDEYFFFPDVLGSYALAGERAILFAGVKADFKKNNFARLVEYNPWVLPDIDSLRNTQSWNFFAGLKGKVAGINYSGKFSYIDTRDLALFLPNIDDARKFDVLYDDGNIVQFEAAISGEVLTDLNAGARIFKNVYDLDNEERAWHLPSTEVQFFANFQALDRKLFLSSTLSLANGVAFLNEENDIDRLNNRLDLSLKGDYYFKENIGAFLMLNNILGNKYQRWQNYPTFGAQIIGGVILRI